MCQIATVRIAFQDIIADTKKSETLGRGHILGSMGYNGNTKSDKENGKMHGFSVEKNKAPEDYTWLVLSSVTAPRKDYQPAPLGDNPVGG